MKEKEKKKGIKDTYETLSCLLSVFIRYFQLHKYVNFETSSFQVRFIKTAICYYCIWWVQGMCDGLLFFLAHPVTLRADTARKVKQSMVCCHWIFNVFLQPKIFLTSNKTVKGETALILYSLLCQSLW